MSRKVKVAAVSGSVQSPSRTLVLVEQLLASLAKVMPIDVHLIKLDELASAIGGVVVPRA